MEGEAGGVGAQPFDQRRAVDHGGRRGLVVGGASPEEHASLDGGLEGFGSPRGRIADVHGVDVGIEHHVDGPVADPADHAAEAVDRDLVVTEGGHLLADPLDHGVLPPGQAGCRDEVGEEPGHPFLLPATLLQEPLLGLHGPPFTLDRGRTRSGRLASSR